MTAQAFSASSKQIILFDVDGVLIHGYHARPAFRQCWDENLQRDFGIDRERFKNEFIYGTFIENILVGKKDLLDELTLFLPKLGYKDDAKKFIDYWLQNDAKINQLLIDKIKLLKASGQTRLFVATNQEHHRADFLMHELGFSNYFEDIFYSARIGAMKPCKAYFNWIANHLNLTPQQKPIFFDDTLKVVDAAKNYGWEAVEFIDVDNLNESSFIKNLLHQEKV